MGQYDEIILLARERDSMHGATPLAPMTLAPLARIQRKRSTALWQSFESSNPAHGPLHIIADPCLASTTHPSLMSEIIHSNTWNEITTLDIAHSLSSAMWNPDGANYSRINLSTASSSSSSAILNNIRAERQARERQRALENAATTVQRIWRGREAASRAREELLSRLEGNGHSLSIPEGASALLFLLKGGTERVRVAEVLQAWCAAAVLPGQGM